MFGLHYAQGAGRDPARDPGFDGVAQSSGIAAPELSPARRSGAESGFEAGVRHSQGADALAGMLRGAGRTGRFPSIGHSRELAETGLVKWEVSAREPPETSRSSMKRPGPPASEIRGKSRFHVQLSEDGKGVIVFVTGPFRDEDNIGELERVSRSVVAEFGMGISRVIVMKVTGGGDAGRGR